MAAGPVTCAVRPSGRSAVAAVRRSVTTSAVSTASLVVTGMNTVAAVPSSATTGGAPVAPGRLRARSSTRASSSGVSGWSLL